MEEKRHYTYKLAYPQGFIDDDGNDLSGIVFYVGKGQGMRIHGHESEARRGCSCRKCDVIRGIWSRNMAVDKSKMLEFASDSAALAHEYQCINVDYAGPYLTNIMPGASPARQLPIASVAEYKERYNALYESELAVKMDVTIGELHALVSACGVCPIPAQWEFECKGVLYRHTKEPLYDTTDIQCLEKYYSQNKVDIYLLDL